MLNPHLAFRFQIERHLCHRLVSFEILREMILFGGQQKQLNCWNVEQTRGESCAGRLGLKFSYDASNATTLALICFFAEFASCFYALRQILGHRRRVLNSDSKLFAILIIVLILLLL